MAQLASLALYRFVQIDDHHDCCLYGSSEQSNEAHPDCYRKVVLQQPEQIYAASQSERYSEQHVRSFQCRVISDVKQSEDNDEHDWHNYQQATAGAQLVSVLAAPLDVVPGGQLYVSRDRILCFVNETAHVAPACIQKHGS